MKCSVYWTLRRDSAIRLPLCFPGSNRQNMSTAEKLSYSSEVLLLNSSNAELNPICHLLALLGAHHILRVGIVRVNVLDSGSGRNAASVFPFGRSLLHYYLLGMWQHWYGKLSCQVALISYGFVINCKILFPITSFGKGAKYKMMSSRKGDG